MTFPPHLPHGPITEPWPNVFVVTGQFRFGPGVAIARNMIVVREGTELTLINSVRLSPEAERELEKLGTVKHLLRIGQAHGADDAWIMHKYQPTYWMPERMSAKGGLTADRKLDGALPIAGTSFRFEKGKHDEVAVVLPGSSGEGGILVTCDSVQNWTSTEHCTPIGGLITKAMGFLEPAKIGPIWAKLLTGGKIKELKPDFDRLLELDFDQLIAGHGSPLKGGAKAALQKQMAKLFA
ncbi:MAG: hypothetical protein Q8O67_19225 [Deltaproteobacteria bacterium]|nr:hypothetical protein [Deltaproteobacteria bacterium]